MNKIDHEVITVEVQWWACRGSLYHLLYICICLKFSIHTLKKIIYLFIYLFIYLWLCWGFVAARGLSLVAASGGYSSLWCAGFSLRWLLSLQGTGSRHAGFSSCGTWAQQLWLTGLVAPRHVGSSRTRAQTRDPALAGRFLTTAPPGKPPYFFSMTENFIYTDTCSSWIYKNLWK